MFTKKYIIPFLALFLFAGFSAFSQVDDPCADFPNGYTNLTPNALATQSSTDGGNLASFAIDGNSGGTSLAMTQNDGNAWLDIQLSSPSYVDEMAIWFPAGQPLGSAYALFSNIPFQSENLAQELANEENEYLYLQGVQSGATFPVNMTGIQYIRIQNENGGVLSLFEVVIPGVTEDCGNGVDDDCDGLVDCDDPDCGPRILNVDITQPTCKICPDGSIFIQASGAGSQYFLYSIDGGSNFQIESTFKNLLPGNYDIVVQNYLTGCEVTSDGSLVPPLGFPSDCCENGGFEEGDFTNWTGGISSTYGGDFQNETLSTTFTPIPPSVWCPCEPTSCARHSILSGNVVDPYIPLQIITPNTGTYVARLGNCRDGKEKERLKTTISVKECNMELAFNYLLVMEAPGHGDDKDPYFRYIVRNETKDMKIANNQIIAKTNNPIFTTITEDSIVYTPWRCVSLLLSENHDIGDEISVEFIVSDCKQEGHFAYAYIDGLCNESSDNEPYIELDLPEAFCSNQEEVIVNVVSGYGYTEYKWTLCELTAQGDEVNCASNPSFVVSQITEPLDLREFYGLSGFQFDCEKTYRITLELNNECGGTFIIQDDFLYSCDEEIELNYLDILNCNNTKLVDITIEGNNLCNGCEYSWEPVQHLDDASIEFPTILGTINFLAMDQTYNVTATNEAGCEDTDVVEIYNISTTIETEYKLTDYCEFELFATLTTDIEISNEVIQTNFFNITAGTTRNSVFVGTPGLGTEFTYKVDNLVIPSDIGTTDTWRVSFIISSDLMAEGNTVVGDFCNLTQDFPIVEPTGFYHDEIRFDIPSVFTPDGNGVNDTFKLIAPPDSINAYYGKLRIWDRWNNKVYDRVEWGTFEKPIDLDSLAWDGNYNGNPAGSDVYIYALELKNCDTPSNCDDFEEYPPSQGSCWSQGVGCTGCVRYKGDVTLVR